MESSCFFNVELLEKISEKIEIHFLVFTKGKNHFYVEA